SQIDGFITNNHYVYSFILRCEYSVKTSHLEAFSSQSSNSGFFNSAFNIQSIRLDANQSGIATQHVNGFSVASGYRIRHNHKNIAAAYIFSAVTGNQIAAFNINRQINGKRLHTTELISCI